MPTIKNGITCDEAEAGRVFEENVQHKGVPRYLGSPDDLNLLLMKAKKRKNLATGRYAIAQGRLSFLGRAYLSPGLLDRLRGKESAIYFDRRDIAVMYLFLEGELVGEAYCTDLLGQPMSIWEADTIRQAALQVLANAGTAAPAPAPTPTGLLAPAIPEEHTEAIPVVRLQIRKRRGDDD